LPAFRFLPHIPESCESERLSIFHHHAHRDLALSFPSPFIESIGWNKAALRTEQMFEGRFLVERLSAGVDHLITYRRILSPRWHQAPTHQLRFVVIALPDNYRDFAAGSDII